MTDLDDLREELQRLGRRPVPAPRHEFVDGLLVRLVGDADVGSRPAPAPLRPPVRRRFAPIRTVALGSIAAALLLAVGLAGLFARGGGSDGVPGGSVVDVELSAAGTGADRGATINADGKVTTSDQTPVADGEVKVVCTRSGQFQTASGTSISCDAGDTVTIEVLGGYVRAAVSPQPTVAPPTTVAPPSTITLTNETVEGQGPIKLSWQPYGGRERDVVYVLNRTERGATTHPALAPGVTSYEEPVPSSEAVITYALEVRAFDGRLLAISDAFVKITVVSASHSG